MAKNSYLSNCDNESLTKVLVMLHIFNILLNLYITILLFQIFFFAYFESYGKIGQQISIKTCKQVPLDLK